MTEVLDFWIDQVPPSSNHAYEDVYARKGRTVVTRRRLSDAGKRFKKEASLVTARHAASIDLRKNVPYELRLVFFFDEADLLNATYPKRTRSRYKKLDVLNRAKLLEDAVSEAIGIDDSHNWVVYLEKRVGENRCVHVTLKEKT